MCAHLAHHNEGVREYFSAGEAQRADPQALKRAVALTVPQELLRIRVVIAAVGFDDDGISNKQVHVSHISEVSLGLRRVARI